MLYKSLKDKKVKNHSDMFRILCDPSSGSTELCLTVIIRSGSQIFCCVLGRCSQPVGPYTHTTRSELRYQTPAKHTTKYL